MRRDGWLVDMTKVNTNWSESIFPKQPEWWCALSATTHWGVDVEVLNLALKLIHDRRDLLEVHGVQSFVQGLGHLTHVFGDLMIKRRHLKYLSHSGNTLFFFFNFRPSSSYHSNNVMRWKKSMCCEVSFQTVYGRWLNRVTYCLHGDGSLDFRSHRIDSGWHAQPIKSFILFTDCVLCINSGTIHIFLLQSLKKRQRCCKDPETIKYVPFV